MTMRITTNMSFDRSISYLQSTNTKIDKASQQYNTGMKFTTASENPTGMGNKIRLDAEISTYTQYSVNAGLAADSLGLEETSLNSIYSTLQNVQTQLQSAVNGTYDAYNFDAIATSIEESQSLLYDLMNTKTSNGEYIFSGSQAGQQTMVKTDKGYECMADAGFRQVKVSSSVQVTTSDSGLSLFEQCATSRTMKDNDDVSIKYVNIEAVNSFVDNCYDATKPDEKNGFNINIGTDANGGKIYTITNLGTGKVLQEGAVTTNGTISFNGMEIEAKDGDVYFNKPENTNVLNTLQKAIEALRNVDMNSEERATILSQVQVDIATANEKINVALGHVGARLNNIDNVINSNESISVIKQETLANISEVDVYDVTSELLKQQNALSVAQQTFSAVNGSTLFDYIR